MNKMEQAVPLGEGRNAMPLHLSEAEMFSIVEAGGRSYVGVLSEIPEKMESIVLFNSPQTRTTLGVPMSRLTLEAVRERLAESNAAFNAADSKWQEQPAHISE